MEVPCNLSTWEAKVGRYSKFEDSLGCFVSSRLAPEAYTVSIFLKSTILDPVMVVLL